MNIVSTNMINANNANNANKKIIKVGLNEVRDNEKKEYIENKLEQLTKSSKTFVTANISNDQLFVAGHYYKFAYNSFWNVDNKEITLEKDDFDKLCLNLEAQNIEQPTITTFKRENAASLTSNGSNDNEKIQNLNKNMAYKFNKFIDVINYSIDNDNKVPDIHEKIPQINRFKLNADSKTPVEKSLAEIILEFEETLKYSMNAIYLLQNNPMHQRKLAGIITNIQILQEKSEQASTTETDISRYLEGQKDVLDDNLETVAICESDESHFKLRNLETTDQEATGFNMIATSLTTLIATNNNIDSVNKLVDQTTATKVDKLFRKQILKNNPEIDTDNFTGLEVNDLKSGDKIYLKNDPNKAFTIDKSGAGEKTLINRNDGKIVSTTLPDAEISRNYIKISPSSYKNEDHNTITAEILSDLKTDDNEKSDNEKIELVHTKTQPSDPDLNYKGLSTVNYDYRLLYYLIALDKQYSLYDSTRVKLKKNLSEYITEILDNIKANLSEENYKKLVHILYHTTNKYEENADKDYVTKVNNLHSDLQSEITKTLTRDDKLSLSRYILKTVSLYRYDIVSKVKKGDKSKRNWESNLYQLERSDKKEMLKILFPNSVSEIQGTSN